MATWRPKLPGVPTYISGTVRDTSGNPLNGVLLDIWQADEEGLYETQIPDSDARLRGLLHTDAKGHYGFWTIAPKATPFRWTGRWVI